MEWAHVLVPAVSAPEAEEGTAGHSYSRWELALLAAVQEVSQRNSEAAVVVVVVMMGALVQPIQQSNASLKRLSKHLVMVI